VSRPAILLASASPRRETLLRQAGWSFSVEASRVDESLPSGIEPERAAELLAERKARAVAALHGGEALLVVGADTLVVVGEAELLGKPPDAAGARAMLELLSGSRHRVITGVAVVRTPDGAARVSHETTWVTMRRLSPREIQDYVASGEWRDKAGGYAIQESADAFVTGLEGGGFDNVVGLPVGLTRELLGRFQP